MIKMIHLIYSCIRGKNFNPMKRILFFSICILFGSFAFGQKERKFIREGNSFFEKGIADTIRRDSISFSKAETEYRKALEIKKDDYNATFNLGGAE